MTVITAKHKIAVPHKRFIVPFCGGHMFNDVYDYHDEIIPVM